MITSIDRFVGHLNMFINSPNVLLEVGFVQSLVCCDLTLKYVSRFQSMFALVKSVDWTVCTLNKLRCGKETRIDVTNSTILLLISNLVFQINFQAVFRYDCA